MNEVKVEIPSITNIATNTSFNAKINEVKGEIPNITNLATTAALTALESKIPNVDNLVKQSDYITKVSEVENKIATDYDHDKLITTEKCHKLTSDNFNARLKQANLARTNDIL